MSTQAAELSELVPGPECWLADCARPRADGEVTCELHDGRKPSPVTVYCYAWANNEVRADLKGRRCVIEATGAMGTCLIRFLDSGKRISTSRRALRRET